MLGLAHLHHLHMVLKGHVGGRDILRMTWLGLRGCWSVLQKHSWEQYFGCPEEGRGGSGHSGKDGGAGRVDCLGSGQAGAKAGNAAAGAAVCTVVRQTSVLCGKGWDFLALILLVDMLNGGPIGSVTVGQRLQGPLCGHSKSHEWMNQAL